ncbi:MAG: monofunctional biosynthetic peptidoglycan transglycosylase [Deltaproteobacteria bacterium]|nr:monofunctional biosynthetic peptidoglycan transglycosylase [Deltaproteobacteria bacterium]
MVRRRPTSRAPLRRVLRWSGRVLAAFLVWSVASVLLLRFVDPPLTPLMVLRLGEGLLHARWVGVEYRWVDLVDVSPALLAAVLVSEDARFFRHHGVDFAEVERARAYNRREQGRRVRGASTITMQCARSTFLWTGRNWLRKSLEVYFTALLELFWSKRRILEVYVNVVEWGDGVYGVGAAAERAFRVSAAKLTPQQAALLAAVLPSPRRWSAAAPTQVVKARAARITMRAKTFSLEPLR